MNRLRKEAQEIIWQAAADQLKGVTGVMVEFGGRTEAGVLLAVTGYVAHVRFASGPRSGQERECPVEWVRPAAAFEVVS